MRSHQLTYSLASVLAVLSYASAASITLWQLVDPQDVTDAEALPTTSIWVEPIGTGSGGAETTFIYNEIDQVEATGTEIETAVTTDSITIVASASGIRYSDHDIQVDCSLTAADSGECVYQGLVDETGTSIQTVTETGLTAIPFAVAVSTAAGEAGASPTGSSATGGSASGGGASVSASAASPSQSNDASAQGFGSKAAVLGMTVMVGVVCGLVL